jgi:predicted transcriptional regulator
MMTERKNNRGKIQIMGDVLGLATSGIKKTHIMYRGNLSYEQAHQYLSELMEKGLVDRDITNDGTTYRTTDKGREFLSYYNRIVEFLDDREIMHAAAANYISV